MGWEVNKGSYVFHGLALDTKPSVGHIVRLNKCGLEFDLEIVGEEGGSFQGKIICIGQRPAVEAFDLRRDDVVVFKESHIQRLSCSA